MRPLAFEFAPDSIYCGDNLDVLKHVPGGIVDLCYIDPPFFSRRNHSDRSKATAEVRGFKDTWSGDIQNYVDFMRPRVQQIHRVLRPGGTFYLHCDVSGVFHLKVMCDEIFGPDAFMNDIIWKRHSPSKNTGTNYGSIVDHVLFYTKGPGHTFNVQYIPMDDVVFNLVEEGTERRFRSQPLVVKGNQEGKVFDFGGRTYTIKKGMALKWSQETIDARLAKNPRLIYWTGGGEPRYKTYLDESKGIKLTSLWDDIKLFTSTSSERLAYPTQKPIKFMARVVSVSSNAGDLVLDAFCGSGTTLLAARNLGRRFAGIDASPTACRLAGSRLGIQPKNIMGHPATADAFDALPPFEFVNWVSWIMNATQKHDLHSFSIDIVCRHTKVPVVVKQGTPLVPGDLEGLLAYLSKARHTSDGTASRGACISTRVDPGVDSFIANIAREKGATITRYSIDDLLQDVHVTGGVSVRTRLV